MTEAAYSVLCGFALPEIGWTHDPERWDQIEIPQFVLEDGITYRTVVNGWTIDLINGLGSPRCGVAHPGDPDRAWGSCGGAVLHEYPHLWCWNDWSLKSVGRIVPKTVH